ncbi:hypothetical protein [Acinetobacter sp. WZC-1]|uniref:hypothetical protein n=1 Tax=Acinetobacter sp. WZC-1 TaxID=3459034 RepID=UPI00403D69B8
MQHPLKSEEKLALSIRILGRCGKGFSAKFSQQSDLCGLYKAMKTRNEQSVLICDVFAWLSGQPGDRK